MRIAVYKKQMYRKFMQRNNSSKSIECGFKEGSECSILSNQWYNFCLSKVDQATAEWMGTLPRELMFEIAGLNFLSTHATPNSINEFIPWINSGASGMPANDGTARVWFATLEAKDDGLTIEAQSVEYDHKQAQVDMQNAGLVNGYMECLATGFWPSDDILPYPEKALAGIPLKPQKKAFKRTPFKKTILA